MKLILDFTNFDNNNFHISTLHGIEVNSKTIGIITKVIATEASRTSNEINSLKAEIGDLKKINSDLLRLNSELNGKVIELETEVKNQKKILDIYVRKNFSSKTTSKNSTSDNSKLESGGNMKLGDDIISGNQQVQITNNNYYNQPTQKSNDSSTNLKS